MTQQEKPRAKAVPAENPLRSFAAGCAELAPALSEFTTWFLLAVALALAFACFLLKSSIEQAPVLAADETADMTLALRGLLAASGLIAGMAATVVLAADTVVRLGAAAHRHLFRGGRRR